MSKMLRSSRARFVAGVSALVVAGPAMLGAAMAQDASTRRGETQGETTLPTLTVTGAPAGDVRDPYQVPGAVSEVSTTDIETSGGDVREALRDVPGTFTRINPQNPGIAVNIRGMEGSGRVNMMIDGVRQNFRFTGHEAQGFTYVDPALLAGVGIERGAVATTGGGALAGSANFRTIGIDDIIKPGRTWGAIGNLNWGDNGLGWGEMAAGAARVSPGFAIGGAISHRKSSNYVNGDGVEVPGTGQDLLSGLVKADIDFSDSARLALGGVFYNNDFFANSYWQTISNNTYTAKFSYKPDDPLIDFRFNAAYNDLKMTYDPNRNTGSSRGRVINDKGWGLDGMNISRFMLGSVAVKADYGAEYFHDDVDVVNSLAVPDYGVNPNGKSSVGGVFSQTKFSYGLVDLTTALRYDFFTLNGKGSVVAGNPLGMPAGPYSVDRSEGRFDPKVTLAVRAADWITPYVTYAETFRAPTVSETLTGGEHPGSARMSFFPNPFLKPEVSKGWEAGVNIRRDGIFAADDFFRAKINYFRNDVDDYVTACFLDPATFSGVHFCNNPGTSLVQGVELQSEFDAGHAFLNLNYAYIKSDLPEQMNGFGAASFIPEHVLVATLGGRFLERRLTVGGRFTAVSQTYIGAINAAPGASPFTPAYQLLDLFASYKFDDTFEVGVNVTNLFDTAYAAAVTTSSAGMPTLNGRGRTVLLNARAHF